MRKLLLVLLFTVFSLICGNMAFAQTVLNPGDIVLLAFNGDGEYSTGITQDGFSFMPLVNLEAGTEIFFTEIGWSDLANAFIYVTIINDQMVKYTAPTAIAAGTIIRNDEMNTVGFTAYSSNTTYNLAFFEVFGTGNATGEEILVFQGSRAAPTFIFAASQRPTGWETNVAAGGGWNGSIYSGDGSALPPGLTDDVTALSLAHFDNYAYTGPTDPATAAVWKSRIGNPSNWTGDDATPTILSSGSYSITDAPPLASTPTVSTTAAASIAATSATLGGNVTADGGATVDDRGVVYSLTSDNANPQVGGANVTKVQIGDGTGAFSQSIGSLTPNSGYSFCAYAHNSEGYSYGSVSTFTTTACINPTSGGTIGSNQQICTGTAPVAFTSTGLPTGHTGTLEYKWQSSTTSASAGFGDIEPSNSTTYSPGALNQTTWYKRLARVDCKGDWAGAAESNVILVKINQKPVDQTVSPASQAVCSGNSATISIESSELSTSYYLRDNSNNAVVDGPEPGTGSAINFNTGNISSEKTFNVYAEKSHSLNFDGSNDYVLVNHTFPTFNNYTLSTWVYLTDVTNAKFFSSLQYELAVVSGKVQLFISGRSGITGTADLAMNQWNYISITFDGANLYLYINGILDNSVATSVDVLQSVSYLTIGKHFSTTCCYVNGYMSELSFESIYHTQAEIRSKMMSGYTGVEPGLVAYYNFGDGTGSSTLTDRSANQFSGVLINMNTQTAWASICGQQMSSTATVSISTGNTAGAASSSPTLCPNTPLTAITHTTTGATGIGAATGLPAGVTATFESNTITIEGTPTESGTFSYSIPLTGGCGSISATGTIIVRTPPLPALSGNNNVDEGSTGNVYTTDEGMTNYLWSVSAGGSITAGGGDGSNTVTVTWNNSGAQTVSVNYTDGNGCSAAASTRNVTVRPNTVYLSQDYSAATLGWGVTHFNNLATAISSSTLNSTIHVSNYTHTGALDADANTYIIDAADFVVNGTITATTNHIQAIGTGYLVQSPDQNVATTYPIGDGTNNYSATITCANAPTLPIKMKINNNKVVASSSSVDFWDISGETGLNATIELRIPKTALKSGSWSASNQIRIFNGSRYVPVPAGQVSAAVFEDYVEVTITEVNSF